MVLVEAMASGCAVITTTAQGCVEVAGDGALFYDPGDTAALSELLRRITREPDLMKKMQAKARAAVQQFDIDFVARDFVRVFEAVRSG
jgi:glycosyltransferase involved in cell wall biosynthesis